MILRYFGIKIQYIFSFSTGKLRKAIIIINFHPKIKSQNILPDNKKKTYFLEYQEILTKCFFSRFISEKNREHCGLNCNIYGIAHNSRERQLTFAVTLILLGNLPYSHISLGLKLNQESRVKLESTRKLFWYNRLKPFLKKCPNDPSIFCEVFLRSQVLTVLQSTFWSQLENVQIC